jgi:hypothetical protein
MLPKLHGRPGDYHLSTDSGSTKGASHWHPVPFRARRLQEQDLHALVDEQAHCTRLLEALNAPTNQVALRPGRVSRLTMPL